MLNKQFEVDEELRMELEKKLEERDSKISNLSKRDCESTHNIRNKNEGSTTNEIYQFILSDQRIA